MKRLIIIVVMVLFGTKLHSQIKAVYNLDVSQVNETTFKKFKVTHDKFTSTQKIEARNSGYSSKFLPYIVIKDQDKMSLRLIMRHYGSKWLFIDKLIVLINDQKYEIHIEATNNQVQSYNEVTETADVQVDQDLYNMLSSIKSKSDIVEISFRGESVHKNIKLQRAEVNQIISIMQLFKKLVSISE